MSPRTEDLVWATHVHTIPAALHLLPGTMASREARALLLAIGLQESGFQARRQHGDGPARGFWMFETAGVHGVLTHALTQPVVAPICDLLVVEPTPAICHQAIEYGDVLAAVFARLLLWTDPRRLPGWSDAPKAWRIYRETWRPGHPRPETWAAHFAHAWAIVTGELLDQPPARQEAGPL